MEKKKLWKQTVPINKEAFIEFLLLMVPTGTVVI